MRMQVSQGQLNRLIAQIQRLIEEDEVEEGDDFRQEVLGALLDAKPVAFNIEGDTDLIEYLEELL